MKVIKTLGASIIIVVLLLLWHHFLVSSRPPKLNAWEFCKTKILEDWAASHSDKSEPLRHFIQDHAYSFGAASSMDRFDDHDSRNTAVSDAAKLGISEQELVQLDRRIANECDAFPHQ
jgi:hypothetical protein